MTEQLSVSEFNILIHTNYPDLHGAMEASGYDSYFDVIMKNMSTKDYADMMKAADKLIAEGRKNGEQLDLIEVSLPILYEFVKENEDMHSFWLL